MQCLYIEGTEKLPLFVAMSLNLPNFCLVNRNIVFDKGRNSNVKFIHQKPKVFVGNCRYNK